MAFRISLKGIYEKNLPFAIENVQREEKQSQAAKKDAQSQAAKKRKADEDAQMTQSAAAASSSTQVEASSSARPFLEPEPTKSSA